MILAVAALLFQFPAAGAVSAPSNALNQPTAATVVSAAPVKEATTAIPKAAGSKVNEKAALTLPPVEALAESASQPMPKPPIRPLTESASQPISSVYVPPPPAFRPPDETPVTHRKLWILLSVTEHGSAGFDAWSTRYALSNGRVEADPVMRPFAGSPAIYGAIQVIPIGLDYVAHRFQRSSGWTRHIWWVPQSAAAATFLFSGSYNLAHTN